tara:strand:- start:375 stop:602 length:228 start_codon:yes stop_codon:yes gene_type:complete
MDILLLPTARGTQITPTSIHGILWLQTHFATKDWESLAANLVVIPNENALELKKDASQAGIILDCLPVQCITSNF